MNYRIVIYSGGEPLHTLNRGQINPYGDNAIFVSGTEEVIAGTMLCISEEDAPKLDLQLAGDAVIEFLGSREIITFQAKELVDLYLGKMIRFVCKDSNKVVIMTSPFAVRRPVA